MYQLTNLLPSTVGKLQGRFFLEHIPQNPAALLTSGKQLTGVCQGYVLEAINKNIRQEKLRM